MNRFLRTGNNYDMDAASKASGFRNSKPSLTVKSDKEDADINTIVRRFGLTGQIPSNVRVPLSADFIDVVDFKDAMNAIRSAQESFAEMPAEVRKRFNNDPELFVAYCTEVKDGQLANLEDMRKLGLAVPAVAPPAKVEAPVA